MAGSELLLTLLGAVALLLWGVRMVRTGMTRAFGNVLRTTIAQASQNRLTAFAAGVGVTSILQSSTATALLLASFAGRGLVSLTAALAIMLGADVGTTLVAQVFALDIKWLWTLGLISGVVIFNSARDDRAKAAGRILIGLGLMLLALTVIAGVASHLRESATVKAVLGAVGSEPVIAILVAALLTWIAHSSLAIVLFIMSLAATGIIDARIALALVLGANIGGSVAPFMALSGSPVAARRVPLGNLIARATVAIVAIPLIGRCAEALAPWSGSTAQLALNFHMLFNLAVAIVWLPFLSSLAAAATRLLPAPAGAPDRGSPQHLDPSVLDTPSEALACAMRETLHAGDIVLDMLRRALPAIESGDTRLIKELEKCDDAVDRLHEAIKLYLIRASKADMGEADSRRYVEILTFNTNLEHIGDIIDKNLMDLATKKAKKGVAFSVEGAAELKDFHAQVLDNMRKALNVFATRDVAMARRLLIDKTTMRAREVDTADRHFGRLRDGRPESIETSAIHLDIIRDLKRINSHLTSVAYPILEAAGELSDTRLKVAASEREEARKAADRVEDLLPADGQRSG